MNANNLKDTDIPVNIILDDVEYKMIPGYPYYYISKDGNIYSLRRHKFMTKAYRGVFPYPIVGLYYGDKQYNVPVHKLVALAWIPLPKGVSYDDVIKTRYCHYWVVDHIDHDINNYHADNLRWITQVENMRNLTPGKSHGSKGNTNACGRHEPYEHKRWIYMYQGQEYSMQELLKVLNCSKSKVTESFRRNMGLVRMGLLTRKQK